MTEQIRMEQTRGQVHMGGALWLREDMTVSASSSSQLSSDLQTHRQTRMRQRVVLQTDLSQIAESWCNLFAWDQRRGWMPEGGCLRVKFRVMVRAQGGGE